jgi:glucose-6-phosphate dehydrogenase assembly protein OpcA
VAEAVVLDRWDGTDVRLGDVINHLIELRRHASRSASKTSVMTLVIVAANDDEAYRARQATHVLGVHHPARLIILRPQPDRQPVGIDARVTIYGARATDHPVTFDEVGLNVRAEAATHLESIIEPFTLSDLPVVLWYPGGLPSPSDPLLAIADTILVDSKEAGEVFEGLAELARDRAIVDLSWERLRPWRELLAGLFEGPAYRPFVRGVTAAEVSGKRGPRNLLAGWLASRLGLSRSHFHLTDAMHAQVVLHATAAGRTGHFSVDRSEDERIVRAGAVIEDGPHHHEMLPLPHDSLAWSLGRALTHLGRDYVWEEALAASVVPGLPAST